MKVLLISSEPVDYTIAFANGLSSHVETVAVLPRQRYAALRDWIDPGVTLDLMDWPRNRSLRNPAFVLRLAGRIRAHRPDILHVLSNTTLWLNALAPLRGAGLPLVTTVHDVTLHPGDRDTARLPAWGARMMARQSDHLVVHGETLRRAAAAAFGKPLERVNVLQHPAIRRYADLAHDLGLTRSQPPGSFTVLLFGRIFAYKGLETLVRAEALLGDRLPGLRIVIAGRGDDPMRLAPLMGRPDRYDIRRGFVEDCDAAQLFTDADLVVLPYDEASQSGVLHMATTFGKPVVVTDVGELRATVTPNGIGLVVPPGAPLALAKAMEQLALDPLARATLGGNALSWSHGKNAPSSIGISAAALYRRIIGQGEMPSPERWPEPPSDPNCRPGADPSKLTL